MAARPLICAFICLEDFANYSLKHLFGSLRFIHEQHITAKKKKKSIVTLAYVFLCCWQSSLNVGSKLKGLMQLYAVLVHTEALQHVKFTLKALYREDSFPVKEMERVNEHGIPSSRSSLSSLPGEWLH